jgi:hypothetical protein
VDALAEVASEVVVSVDTEHVYEPEEPGGDAEEALTISGRSSARPGLRSAQLLQLPALRGGVLGGGELSR